MSDKIQINVDPQKQIAILARKLADTQAESARWEAVAQAAAEKLGELIKKQNEAEKVEPSAQK